jgi:dihydroorotate dehydrogenase (fumarate)
MKLTTRYLGLELPHPFMAGASPLVDDLDLVRRLEDAGSAAIVMHSLYEEQLTGEELTTHRTVDLRAESSAEATSYFPRLPEFALGPEEYLEQIWKIKELVDLPVIGSLNGTTPGGWLQYAKLIQEAGADALEVNLYGVPTSPLELGEEVEERVVRVVQTVTEAVSIPVAVKLSPYYSSLAHLAVRLEAAGAKGLVLFNRFYQADIDPQALEVMPVLQLSDPSELLLRLRWLAILSAAGRTDLAVSGGVHSGVDGVKAVMAGAHAVQVVSALLKHGPERLAVLRDEFTRWVEGHEYESLDQMRGSMNLSRCPDPRAFERVNYLRVLQGWRYS